MAWTAKMPPPCPPVPEALLTYLDAMFPNQCAREGDTPEQIWIAAGARKVVDHLKAHQPDEFLVNPGDL
ncbi:hypothetical protein GIW81_00915 [Hyphomicrobium sp. xq]|uniref:Uncharacterized protein n=1 Tax=Hyphomicrobium album TaxID=2665159 RepID=A0A6I3KF15_9HYPH|nr:hypothetical protein [Hyphomicrobium album]MTD92889.1 hypothetical protein [Hyphomicrobium album]